MCVLRKKFLYLYIYIYTTTNDAACVCGSSLLADHSHQQLCVGVEVSRHQHQKPRNSRNSSLLRSSDQGPSKKKK